MICKCKAFLYRDGVLCCSVCGKPAQSSGVEDKSVRLPEAKRKLKTEVK